MNAQQKAAFRKVVYRYYEKAGRNDLPWRPPTLKPQRNNDYFDPYKIAVSEIMLQQTQVARVVEKYNEFLNAFPTVQDLAAASLQQVLLLWSGLGYNRRARFLHQMAQAIVHTYKRQFPKSFDALRALPGIGPYTAGAIMAFAYNEPILFIETNIRTVYLHHFFSSKATNTTKDITKISDRQLLPLIETTLDSENPRLWYWALMDYGSYLKNSGIHIHRHSAHYKKQSTFKGSLRQVRGAVIKILTIQPATLIQLQNITGFEKTRVREAAESLMNEGLVKKKGQHLEIA